MMQIEQYDTFGPKEDNLKQKLISNIPNSEEFLYISEKISNQRLELLVRIFLMVAFFLLMPIIASFFIPEISIFNFYFTFPLTTLMTIVVLLYINWGNRFKKTYYVFITGTKIYVYESKNNKSSMKSINWMEIDIVSFSRNWYDGCNDAGTMEIIGGNFQNTFFTVNFIPNITELQQIIESILHKKYKKKEELMRIIDKEPKPFLSKINISKNKLRLVKYDLLNNMLVIGVFLVVFSLIAIVIFTSPYRPIVFIGFHIVAAIFGLPIIAVNGGNVRKLARGSCKPEENLFIENSSINLAYEGKVVQQLSLSKEMVFEPFNIANKNFGKNLPDLEDRNIDGIQFQGSYRTKKDSIRFGPVDNHYKVCKDFYSYILKWKYEHGFLFDIEEKE